MLNKFSPEHEISNDALILVCFNPIGTVNGELREIAEVLAHKGKIVLLA